MMNAESKRMNVRYAAIQGSFFGGYAVIWSFTTPLLLWYGFTNAQVGVVTAIATLASVALAPMLSSYISRSAGLTDRHGAVALVLLSAAATAFLLIFRVRSLRVVAVAFALIGAAQASVPPFQNAMCMAANRDGIPIMYGLCRGIGSVAYAVAALLLGLLLEDREPGVLLPLYLLFAAINLYALRLFRSPLLRSDSAEENGGEAIGTIDMLRIYPRFALALVGGALYFVGHTFANVFINSIVARANGSEREMGLALAICAAVELPAMVLVSRLQGRVSSAALLRVAAVGGVVKMVVYCCATTMPLVYLAQALQFVEFGTYTPVSVYYVDEMLPGSLRLRGQSLIHVAGCGLGAALGSLASGWLIDLGGIAAALAFSTAASVASMVVFFFAVRPAKG